MDADRVTTAAHMMSIGDQVSPNKNDNVDDTNALVMFEI